ncbi:MAG: CRISPR-associated endoribonuclease Cas6 [Bacteroidales bacterium]
MRLHLVLEGTSSPIPFNYQHKLTGVLHKWLGQNDLHDKISLYSFSQLDGGKAQNGHLNFEYGGKWFISIWEKQYAKQLIDGIQRDPDMFLGLQVREVILQEDPDLSEKTFFQVASPVHIKHTEERTVRFILFNDPTSTDYLTATLKHKMKQAGMPEDETLNVRFDTSYPKAKTKLITYKDVKNKCNWCPIIIEGKPESKAFAWNVGVGNSTGIGFGAIK